MHKGCGPKPSGSEEQMATLLLPWIVGHNCYGMPVKLDCMGKDAFENGVKSEE